MPSSGSFSVTASNSPTSYSWAVLPFNSGVIISNPTGSVTSIIFPFTGSDYTIVCVANNSSGTSSIPAFYVVTVNETPQVTFSGANSNVYCQGSPTSIQASPTTIGASSTISYTWTPPSGLSSPYVSSPVASPSVTTNYTVLFAMGTCTNTSQLTISVVTTPTMLATLSQPIMCPYGTNTIFVTGNASSYSINATQAFSVVLIPPNIFTPGTYPLNITGSNGPCIGAAPPLTMTVAPIPPVIASLSRTAMCVGENNSINIIGSASYSIDGVACSSVTPVSNTATSGSYIYTVTAVNPFGCQNTKTLSLSVSSCTELDPDNQLENNRNLKVYPNPNNGKFYVKTSTTQDIVILDELGRVTKRVTTEPNREIQIDNLSPGIYYLVSGKDRTKLIITK
jgi:hypothetical protein